MKHPNFIIMPEYIVSNKANTVHANKQKNERSFFRPLIQARLTVNQPNDIYEQEADAVADQVMRMSNNDSVQTKFFSPSIATLQRKCQHCEEEEKKKMQRKELNGEGINAGKEAEGYVDNLGSSGQSLSPHTRSFYEARLGYDFSNVKVHTDNEAARSAQSFNALAYTSGNNIVFNSGQYSPATDSGKKLLAHELTHVVQQAGAGTSAPVQKKAVDDASHLPCRAKRPTAFADLQGWEQQAITLCRGAATGLRNFKPGMTGKTESAASQTMRDLLWRRFHLNYDRFAKCAAMPKYADMYDKVADNISGIAYTYNCAEPGKEPDGTCKDKPGVGWAWTATGIAKTQLCDDFWNQSGTENVQNIIHELFHYSYSLGDCPSAANNDNPECFALFASEFGGATTSADTHGTCCLPPKDPLPPLDMDAVNSSGCPSGITIGLPELEVGYSHGPGGHGKFLSAGLDLSFPFSSTSDWEIGVGPRAKILDSLDKEGRDSYLIGLRARAQLRSRPWRSGFVGGGYLEFGGALDVPAKSGELVKGNYIEVGAKLGAAIRLPKDKALTIFAEFAGGQVNTNDNTLRYFTAAAGISIDW